MTKHVHAELMAQYAKDALETNRPWERWECRKPQSVTYEVTRLEPYRGPMKIGQKYWVADSSREEYASLERWGNSYFDTIMLDRGLLYLTEEEAIAAAKAMLEPEACD